MSRSLDIMRTGSHGWLAWFAGNAGDGGDQALNFVAGVADATTPTSYWVRKGVGRIFGYDGADEESTAYFAGEVTGTVVSFAVPTGAIANRLSNSFNHAGKCANWLTKLRHAGCFVAGTPVTLSALPRTQALDEELFASDEFAEALWGTLSHTRDEPERNRLPHALLAAGVAVADSPSVKPRQKAQTLAGLLIPIEQVPLGARVPTKNPRPWEVDASLPEPDQATWAKLSLTMVRDDGGVVDAELIRPQAWIRQHGIEAGQLLPMHIEELQVGGSVLVNSIGPCPVIATGEGSVVTARFCTREVHEIVRVEILGPSGEIETLEGTAIHPIWSLDRNDWVPLGELEAGEQLLAADGLAIVLAVHHLRTAVPVYNIEVHGEHVYEVGKFGVLVHNTTPECAAALAKFPGSRIVNLPLRIAPGAKEFADPENIMRLGGKFDWTEYAPILVRVENGVPTLYEGMTRVELALRAGIMQLPAFFMR
jgi:hypothetical protein